MREYHLLRNCQDVERRRPCWHGRLKFFLIFGHIFINSGGTIISDYGWKHASK